MLRFTVATMLFPLTVMAQGRDSATVPMELARALVIFGEMGGAERDPEIVVGRVAEAGMAAMVPATARVLGGVISGSQRNRRHLTIMTMAERPDSALVLVGKALEAAGYKTAPTFESMQGARGGFASSSRALVQIGGSRPGGFISYCSDRASVSGSVLEADNGGSLVSLTLGSSLRNSMCDPAFRSRMMGVSSEDMIELPTLRPPAGAVGGPRGMSGGGDSREAEARLQSNLSAAAMLDHFAPQLTEQGWTLVNRANEGDVSVQTARRTDKNGEPLHLSLIDTRYGTREHEVVLRVWRQSRDR